MKGVKIASRYAKSLITLALEQNVLEIVFNDMTLFLDTCKTSKELTLLLKSPIVKADKKIRIIEEIFAETFHQSTLLFLNLLVNKRREMMAEAVADRFIHFYKVEKKIKTAAITTAIQLDDSLKILIKEKIKPLINGNIDFEEKVKESIIGGFIVRIDDTEINASIANKLNKLKQEFDINPYIKDY